MAISYSSLPITRGILRRLDQDIKLFGIQTAMKNLFLNSKSKIESYNLNSEIQKILKKEPTLIIAEHVNPTDPAAILSVLPQRRDVFVIINSDFLGLSPYLDKHFIPVYINHDLRTKEYKEEERLNYYLLKILKILHPSKTFSESKEHQRNIQSIAKAGNILSKGGLVILFPGGGTKDRAWKKGVGYLISQLKTDKKVQVLFVSIKGTSFGDGLRIVYPFGKLLPNLQIHFSYPLMVNHLFKRDPGEITNYLSQNYRSWSQSLTDQQVKSSAQRIFFPAFFVRIPKLRFGFRYVYRESKDFVSQNLKRSSL